jgi:uncharacterized protein (DUF2249 family)
MIARGPTGDLSRVVIDNDPGTLIAELTRNGNWQYQNALPLQAIGIETGDQPHMWRFASDQVRTKATDNSKACE